MYRSPDAMRAIGRAVGPVSPRRCVAWPPGCLSCLAGTRRRRKQRRLRRGIEEKYRAEEVLCRLGCGYSMFVGSGHVVRSMACASVNQRLSGAQPRGVTTPKKQSPLFAATTWLDSTGMMTTPAEARAAAQATTTPKESCILFRRSLP